jgi:hypothetical protein
MLHLRNQSGGELSIKTEQHEICGQRTVLYLQGFDGDRPGLGEIRRVLVSHSACPIPGLGFQFVPENSGAKTGRIKKEKNEKHGIFQGKGGVREEKWGRECTPEIGDGGGGGQEGDDEARAEGSLQEYRRGVSSGHGVFSVAWLGTLTWSGLV